MMKCKPVAKVMVAASRNKPEILAVTGGVAVVTAFVLAIRGGTKVKAVMAKGAEKVEAVEARKMQELSVEDLTEEQKADILKACGKDLKMARADGVWQVAKLFLLPSGLLVIGLVLIGGGHHILKKRNVVLAGLAEGYKTLLTNYRKNVVQAEGEEVDQKYLHDVIGEKDIEKVIVGEDGKEKKVKKRVAVVNAKKNPWRFEFSDTWFWSYVEDTERNLFFLKCEEDWWNHELDRNGEVSMYEVLKHLGYKFDLEKEGVSNQEYRDRMTFLRNYGWRKGCGGDDFIDFGLYRAINEAAMKRQSDTVWLEFNCDGNLENLTELNNSKWR
jgi:hypothetical protein